MEILGLLTFFIIASLFLTKSEGLPVNSPQASAGKQTIEPERLTVIIDAQCQLSLNRKPTTLDVLSAQIRAAVNQKKTVLVVINADEKANMDSAVAVMDLVQQISGTKIAIATRKK